LIANLPAELQCELLNEYQISSHRRKQMLSTATTPENKLDLPTMATF
jgi:hypothetical protein